MAASARGSPWVETPVLAGACVTAGLSALGALLAALGWWRPLVVWPLALLLCGVAVLVARRLPDDRVVAGSPVPLVAVVIVLTAWMTVTHGEQVLPRRDAGSNLQAAVALGTEGSRRIEIDPADLGGPAALSVPGVTLESPAFYAVGYPESPAVEPQFVVGVASVLSLGWWLGGVSGAELMPPLALGLALLGVGALVARQRGWRWGAVAAGLLGTAYPLGYIGRTTFSESFALLLLVAAALALESGLSERSRGWGVLAGLLLGSSVLVRVDTVREIALLSAVLGAGLVADRGQRPVLGWALASLTLSGALAMAANVLHSPRYLQLIESSLRPAVLIWLGCLVAGPLIGLGVGRLRGSGVPLGTAVAALTAVVLLALASRPWWMVARQAEGGFGSGVVEVLQAAQGLPVDGARTYAESTVTWLSWYAGAPAVLAAGLVLVAAVRRLVTAWLDADGMPSWLPVVLVGAGSSILTLWRPGITPDHPWADRRMIVPLVLVIVLLVLGVSSVRGGGWRRWTARGLLAATVGFSIWGSAPLVVGRVERGSAEAVAQVCSQLAPGDVVIAADDRAANEWPQVVRGMCGVPALALDEPTRRDSAARESALGALRTVVTRGGGRLRVLTTAGAGAPVARVVMHQDAMTLTRPPRGHDRLVVEVWLSS